MKRQPRAKLGGGGYAPSMKGKDPRGQRMQPTVAEDLVLSRALQVLSELPGGSSQEDVLSALNGLIRTLKGTRTP